MTANTNLVTLLAAAVEEGLIDLDALLAGTKPVTVKPRKVSKKTVAYTRVDGETIKVTPKQARFYESRKTLTDTERAAKAEKREEFLAKRRAYAAQREALGLPPKKDVKFANRAAADMERRNVGTGEWATTRDLILTGKLTPDAQAIAYASK